MQKNSVRFDSNSENISGAILYKDETKNPPNLVFFHGGGGNKERIYPLLPPLIKSGVSVLTIDFSGHGESTGYLKKSSLKKRNQEAKTAIDYFAKKDDSLVICGASMGGYTAIKMLEFYKIKSLILLCPALYDKNAFDIIFDEGFSEIIRTPNSWRNTDALELLKNFTGNLLLVTGSKDEVIPPEIIELIMQHTPNTKRKELYVIPECHHKIFDWIVNKDLELKNLQQKIMEYI